MWPIVTDRVAWSVGLSVCPLLYHSYQPRKNSWTDRAAVSRRGLGWAQVSM